jgi:hypothetical protein
MQERGNDKRNLDVIPDNFLLQQLIAFNMDGNFDAVMGFIGCIIGLEEIHNTSKKKNVEDELSGIDKEFDELLVNNDHIFYVKNEKLSKTENKIL